MYRHYGMILAACSLTVTVGASAQLDAPARAQSNPSVNKDTDQEAWVDRHIARFREDISNLGAKPDKNSVDDLIRLIDLHTRYENYIVKGKEAQHASVQVYGPIIMPLITAVVGFLGGLFLARYSARKASPS
jgi:hypothetical protein